MTCASCVARNEKALRKLEGVDEADVNFATEKAHVVFDPAVLSPHDLVATVEKAGYGVVTAEETLPVLGMTCASCVSRVERALKRTPGVLEAQVNLATEKATVAYVPGQASHDGLVAAIRGAGYDVAIEAGGGEAAAGGLAATDAALDREQAARRRRLSGSAPQGHRRLRPHGRHLHRHHADGLVHVPAGLAAQRLPAVGARHARPVLGRRGSSTRARGPACATASA